MTSGESGQGDGRQKSAPHVRPQIAAMEKGPGPGVYRVPHNVVFEGHGNTKHRNPAWTMKGKYGKFVDDSSK